MKVVAYDQARYRLDEIMLTALGRRTDLAMLHEDLSPACAEY